MNTYIFKDVEIIDNLPAIYIKSIDSIVIADLHLGYEGIVAEQGIFIPKTQFKEEMRMMKKILRYKKKLSYKVIETDLPSPFAHGLIILGEADIITMKENR